MRSKIFYGWWIVTSCFFIGFIVSGVVFYGFTAFFEPILREFRWSYTQVSLASSIRGVETGILAPLVGYLADRWGARRILLLGMVVLGLALILLGQIQSLLAFYMVMLLVAFGAGGCANIVTMTVVVQWFRRHLGTALAAMSSGLGASGLMLPIIVFLIDEWGWRHAVSILGIFMWIVGIPLVLIIRDTPEAYGYGPDGNPITPTPVHEDPEKQKRTRINYWSYLKYKPFLMLNLAEMCRFMALSSVVVHIMPYLSQMGIPRSRAGFIAAAIPIISIAGRFLFGWMGDVQDKGRVSAWAFLVMAIGITALAFIDHTAVIFCFLLLFPVGFGGLMVLRGSIVAYYYDKRVFGTLMGILMGFSAVGGIIGPTVTGWVFDHWNNYSYAWCGFGVLLIASAFLSMKGVALTRLHPLRG